MAEPHFDTSGKEDSDMRKRRGAVVAKLRQVQKVVGHSNAGVEISRAADAVESCCMRPVAFYLFDDASRNRLERARCRHRLCPHCRNVVAAHVGTSITDLLAQELDANNRLAMLTLPIKHTRADSLRKVRKDLSAAEGLLKKRSFWRNFVSEYHRVAEVEFNEKNGFNAHFHLLIRVGPFERIKHKPAPGKRRGWTETRPLRKADLLDLFRSDKLRKLPAYKWWARYQRRQGRTATEAGFLSITAADIEKMFVEEWRTCTREVGRESYILSYQEVRPGKTPGSVLKRWRDSRTGERRSEERPIAKFTQELVKYVTKGTATGDKLRKGQVGFFQFKPWVMVDYVRGLKNWHLHQSSAGWSKIQQAFEEAEAGTDQLAERDEGCRRVPYVGLVKTLGDAVAGALGTSGDQAFEDAIRDGLAVLPLLTTAVQEGNFDQRILIATQSHLARLLGSDDQVQDFPLTLHEKIALEKLRGRVWSPRMSEKAAAEAMLEATADREAGRAGWDPEVEAQFAQMQEAAR